MPTQRELEQGGGGGGRVRKAERREEHRAFVTGRKQVEEMDSGLDLDVNFVYEYVEEIRLPCLGCASFCAVMSLI